jgi:AsmA protein
MTSLWLRRAAFGLLGLVLIVAAVVAWLVASFDAERYKGVAIDWMQREHRRTLAIDGPVSLSLLPRIEVRAARLRLSEVGRSDTFAALDEAAFAVRVLPLLAGQLVVDRVAVRGVQLAWTRDAKGVSNTDDFTRGGDSGVGAGPSLKFDIGSVELRDVTLRLRDDTLPLVGEVALQSLTAGRIAPGVDAPIELQARVALQQPAVQGEFGGRTRLRWTPDSGALALAGMQLAYKGDAAGLRGVEAALHGDVAWDGAAQSLQATDLRAEFGATAGDVRLAASRLQVGRLSHDARARSLALAKLEVRLAGHGAGRPLAFALDWPALDVAGDTVRGEPFAGTFSLAGANSIEGRFASGAPTGSFEQIRLPGLNVTLAGRNGAQPFDGALKTNAVLRPGKKGFAAEQIDLQARVGAAPQALALATRGSAHISAQAAGWNLAGTLAGNAFASDGSAALGGRVPKLQAQARFDSLDLDALLGRASAPAPKPSSSGLDTPVDLGVLRTVDGRFTLRAARFAWQQLSADDLRLDATLDDGTLRISRLQAQAWGGSVEASGSAAAGSQRIAAKFAASGIDVRRLLAELAGSDRLEGRGRVTAELQTAGASVQALRSQLAGQASVQLRDGAVRGFDLARRLREAKAALTLQRDAVERASQTEKTDFTEVAANFRIADGVARNDDLAAKSPYLRVAGSGAIDIGRSRIDYTLRTTVTDTAQGQGGAELAALRGLTVPVHLAGPLDAVDWRIEWSAVAAGALQRRLEDRLRERLGADAPTGAASAPARPRDALKDALKGLIK